MKQIPDITGDIGPLYIMCKVQMYSFTRPATLLWQGFYEGLRAKGMTHKQAIAELQCKSVRHMLDEKSGLIVQLGKKLAASHNPVCG
jgi:hypothetical protein